MPSEYSTWIVGTQLPEVLPLPHRCYAMQLVSGTEAEAEPMWAMGTLWHLNHWAYYLIISEASLVNTTEMAVKFQPGFWRE